MQDDATNFVQEYYRTLTRTPKTLLKHYHPNATLTIQNENEPQSYFSDNILDVILDKHFRKIEKILIYSFDFHKFDNLEYISVIGQCVYEQGSNPNNIRFVQSFIIKDTKILIDNCRFLDEEVIYLKTKKNLHLRIKGDWVTSKHRILEFFGHSNLGHVESISDDEFVVEFLKQEDAFKALDNPELKKKNVLVEFYDKR